MDAGWGVLIGTAITGVVTVGGSWLTRRSAKETNAVDGFEKLTGRLEKRVEKLEQKEERRAQLADLHRIWDEDVRDKLRELGAPVGAPPPLD